MDFYDLAAIAQRKAEKNHPTAVKDWFDLCRLAEQTDFQFAHTQSALVRKEAGRLAKLTGSTELLATYWDAMLFDAPYDLDSYCLYLEKNREPSRRFYAPRRRQLLPIVQSMQELISGDLKLLTISLPPGVGKTTLAIFLFTALAGQNPEASKLAVSHNNDILRGMYDECLRVMTSDEYLWKDIFPDVPLVSTDAKGLRIDMGKPSRFQTLQFKSVDAEMSGGVRVMDKGLLYCDDLVSGIEEALSRPRLDKLWQQYTDNIRQRKQGDPPELHIATRWSVVDVIGRLEQRFGDDPTARFIRVPALNEKDESNFDFPYGVGYSTKVLIDMRESMEDASWRAIWQNEPIERDGQLYPETELRRYFELPDGEPDGIYAVCDTKTTGKDFCVLPIVYRYGDDYYLEDMVCDNGAMELIEAQLVSQLCEHKVQLAQFESNAAGGKIAEKVQAGVKSRGGRAKVTTKYTTANKETKIIVNAPWVKHHVLFKDDSVTVGKKTYRRFMSMLTGYTMAGRNAHDDVPDAMAQLALFIQSLDRRPVMIFDRPW